MIKILGKNKFANKIIMHKVLKDETVEDISKAYNIPKQIIERKYGNKLYAGECLILTNINKKYHIVKPLDTINEICKQYDISCDELKSKNNITQLFIGQMLEI